MRALRLAALATITAVACRHADTPEPAAPAPASPGVVVTDRPPTPHTSGRVVVTSTDIQILDPIRFEGVTSVVRASGLPMLDAIAHTLDGNPNILLVAVHAYAPDAPPAQQLRLAGDRAKTVIDYLIAHGIAASRLEPRAAAQPPPGEDGRVELEILRRGTE